MINPISFFKSVVSLCIFIFTFAFVFMFGYSSSFDMVCRAGDWSRWSNSCFTFIVRRHMRRWREFANTHECCYNFDEFFARTCQSDEYLCSRFCRYALLSYGSIRGSRWEV